MTRLLAVLPLLPLLAFSSVAHADDDDQPQPQLAPPQSPLPVYVAPLSQQTQTTYVPQSVALSGPDEIDSEEGRRAPLGYTPIQRTRKGLIIGGVATLAASYGICALTAAIGQDTSDGGTNSVGAMWIPVAGPFIQMANTDSATANVFLAGLGAAQVIGAVMLYYGATTTKTVYVRNDLVGSLQIIPTATDRSSGFALSGRF